MLPYSVLSILSIKPRDDLVVVGHRKPRQAQRSGCNTQYLPEQASFREAAADPSAGAAPVSATLLRYFSNGKTTVDVATQTSNSWIDDDEDDGQEVEGAPELVVTGLGVEALKSQQEATCEDQSPIPRSSSGSGERSSGQLAGAPKARRRRKPAHPVSSKLY
ncbi:hypothetical protein WJX84_004357 [Apatococcus fuscideae]|uniref:Uncharacterized protein n=1 Tax=Apatococcus fuscideae TaxID=2026836 RepID=A0AAW1T7I5_9CHLO